MRAVQAAARILSFSIIRRVILLEHDPDPEKVADFSGKIMLPNQ